MRHRLALVGLWLLTTVLATVLATQTVRLVTSEVMYRADFGTPTARSGASALANPTHVRQLAGAAGADASTSGVTTLPASSSSLAPGSTDSALDPTPGDSAVGPRRAVRVPVPRSPTASQTPTATLPEAASLPTRVPIASFPRDTVLTSPTTVPLTAPPTAPTTVPITTTTTPGPPVVVLKTTGGYISIRCVTANTIAFVAASPLSGFGETVQKQGPAEVQVTFTRDTHRSVFVLACSHRLPHVVP